MRLCLALGVLLLGLIVSCGTEHHKSKRQVYQPRGSQRTRTLATSRPTTPKPPPPPPTEEPEYSDEYEDEEEPEAPPQVSYVRRPAPVAAPPPPSQNLTPYRNAPGTGIRNRPQQEVTVDSEESDEGSALESPTPSRQGQTQRRPYIPDPNNEDPDNGGYLSDVSSKTSTTAAPPSTRTAPSSNRKPAGNRNLRGGDSDQAAKKSAEEEALSKILGGGRATPVRQKPTAPPAKPAGPPTRTPARGRTPSRGRFTSTTTVATTVATTSAAPPEEEEDDEEVVTPAPAPVRKVSVPGRPGSRRQHPNAPRRAARPPSTTENVADEEEEKPFTPVPKRTSNTRLRIPKPRVVLERPAIEEDDSEEEPSIPRQVTQKPPSRSFTKTTTTAKPTSRFGNSSRQAEGDKQFRGRFRPKAAVKEDDDDDRYDSRRRGSNKERSRTRGRYSSRDEDEDDYDDYDDYDEPPRRTRNRNRGNSNNRGRGRGGNNNNNRKNRGGRGPTTSPRPSTRVPPIDLEKREDGRIIDYLGDPNLPRELTGFSLVDYPFYMTVPDEIDFDCDERIDGFYASVPHFCQVFHYCHAGNRYSFLCPNYTLYDQTTFTCRYANTVDCKKSAKFFNRNDALYKEKKDETIVTTLLPDPEKVAKEKNIKPKN